MEFKGKNVIITGGSSGIGKSAAKIFATKGSNVTILARREEILKEAVEEISSSAIEANQKISYASIDVSDRMQVDKWAHVYEDASGPPDVIINSAGIAHPGYFEEIPYEIFDQLMKIDFYGVLNMCKSFIPMMKAKGGHIVNISSIAGFLGVFGYTGYSAAKFAVFGFSQALRSEMKKYNITISVLCPPDTDTPQLEMENKIKPKETKAIAGNAGIMSPDDVAKAMIDGMIKKKFIIVPGFNGKLVLCASRWAPSLVEWVMDRNIKKVE
ncbi:MAG: SDR family oxidoreductase [Deltaproteobacteria bacterium]|nr:SDR family oxidoreductase [Deltaproteobacteria bacterium]